MPLNRLLHLHEELLPKPPFQLTQNHQSGHKKLKVLPNPSNYFSTPISAWSSEHGLVLAQEKVD
ncbi:hypothetical protein, partial [Microcystis aeruginosa]|uniref:hypothetical protein n=1 Tax=Microcystis aeruginosa TaxID=1126 RepID=UPI001C8A0EC6